MSNEQITQLIHGCRNNDRYCQRSLYNFFYADIFRVCLRYASTKEEAKELTNDAFFKAFTRLNQFESGTNFGGWLYTIARRTALDRYRVAIQQPVFTDIDVLLTANTHSPEAQILDQIDASEKLRLVQLMPPAYRAVFNLYVVDDMTHEEIAQELGISVGASKSNLSKARAHLKNLIEKHLTNTVSYE